MDHVIIVNKLRTAAEYLKGTRICIGEKDAIERLLGCALALENLAADIEAEEVKEAKPDEADHQ